MQARRVAVTDRSRAQYAHLKSLYRKVPGAIVTQSYLRSEVVLGAQSSLNFPILVNENVVSVNEKRLALPDSFVVTSLSLLTYKLASTAAASSAVLRTFANPAIYAGAGEAAAINAIYNGFLSFRVNSTVYIDSLDNFRFYRVGQAQQSLAVSTAASNNAYFADSYEGGDFPFYSVTPGIQLSGSTKNEIQVTLPQSVNMASPAGATNYAVCYLRGFLIQNGAQFLARK